MSVRICSVAILLGTVVLAAGCGGGGDGAAPREVLRGHADEVDAVAFAPDGGTLASASLDGTVRLWDVARRAPLGEPLRGHAGIVNSVAFAPDGRTLVSAGEDGTVWLWGVA